MKESFLAPATSKEAFLAPATRDDQEACDVLVSDLRQERKAYNTLCKAVSMLALVEWLSVPIFACISLHPWASHALLAVVFGGVVTAKFDALAKLEVNAGDFFTKQAVQTIFAGSLKIPPFIPLCHDKIVTWPWGAPVSKRFYLIVASVPSWAESITTAMALPEVFIAWHENSTARERWRNSWVSTRVLAFVGDVSLPMVLAGTLVSTMIIHAVLFFKHLLDARRLINAIHTIPENVEHEFLTRGFFVNITRNLIWSEIRDCAKHANLNIVAECAGEACGGTLRCFIPAILAGEPPPSEIQWPDDCYKQNEETTIFKTCGILLPKQTSYTVKGKFSSSLGQTLVRSCLVPAVRVWMKVSILADTWNDVSTSGFVNLHIAISCAFITMIAAFPNQIHNIRHFNNGPTKGLKMRLIFSVGLLLASMIRLLGVWTCPSHMFNFSNMGCIAV